MSRCGVLGDDHPQTVRSAATLIRILQALDEHGAADALDTEFAAARARAGSR